MPHHDDAELAILLVAFLASDRTAGARLAERVDRRLRSRIRRTAPPDFENRGLVDDVISRTWELVLRKAPGSYDPNRGRPLAYIFTVARTAVRDIRDENRRLVSPARDYSGDQGLELAKAVTTGNTPTLERNEAGGIDLVEAAVDLDIAAVCLPVPVATAVRLIALNDTTMVTAARVVGMSRFAIKRRLRRWADEGTLTIVA